MKQTLLSLVLLGFTGIVSAQITISNLNAVEQDANVLRYDVSFETSSACHAWVDYFRIVTDSLNNSDTLWNHTAVQGPTTDHFFTIYELVSEQTYQFRVNAFNAGSCVQDDFQSFETNALPDYVAHMDSLYVAPDAELEGYFLTNSLQNPEQYLQLFNRKGELVWYDTHSEEAGLGLVGTCKGFNISEDDHIIRLECHELRVEDLLGNEIAHVDFNGTQYDSLYFHHDAILNADGNYVAIAARKLVLPQGDSTIAVVEEGLLEFDVDGNVLWSWFTYDYYDPYDAVPSNAFFTPIFGASTINWAHWNAVYQDTDGNYIISAKEWHQLFKIDAGSGDIMWKIGGEGSDIEFVPDDHFGDQHGINRTAVGTYILFDNTGLDSLSRILEFSIEFYDIPEAINQWEWALPQENLAVILGSAFRIPGGNRYCVAGNTGSIFEVNSAGEVQWHFRQNYWSYRTFLIDQIVDNSIEEIAMGDNPTLVCIDETGIMLSAMPEGGYWSGPGVSDGLFVPADAGLGVHTLTFKWGWNTESITIEVSDQVPPCVVSVDELTESMNLAVYPNPTKDILNVQLSSKISENCHYVIYNHIGSAVLRGTIKSGQSASALDVSGLVAGSYYIRINSHSGFQAAQFVIE
jgi:arylsulfate sulfotransferase